MTWHLPLNNPQNHTVFPHFLLAIIQKLYDFVTPQNPPHRVNCMIKNTVNSQDHNIIQALYDSSPSHPCPAQHPFLIMLYPWQGPPILPSHLTSSHHNISSNDAAVRSIAQPTLILTPSLPIPHNVIALPSSSRIMTPSKPDHTDPIAYYSS